MEPIVTDAVFHSTTLASGASSRFSRLAAWLERTLHNVAMALSIHRTLEELPDGVLKDLGLARSEIPFVAGELASRHCNPPR
jgi:uncharacterized protein YjiS (DUF1127 family)